MTIPVPRPSRPTRVEALPRQELPPLALEFQHEEDQRRRNRISIYNAIAEHRAEWLDKTQYYANEVKRVLASLVVPGHRVLDVGCGLGDLLASTRPSEGVGIDISDRMIAIAKTRHPGLEFLAADIERDPIDA